LPVGKQMGENRKIKKRTGTQGKTTGEEVFKKNKMGG